MAVLPGVLGCRTLRRTVQVRLGSNSLRLSGITAISTVSRQQFMQHPGFSLIIPHCGVMRKFASAPHGKPYRSCLFHFCVNHLIEHFSAPLLWGSFVTPESTVLYCNCYHIVVRIILTQNVDTQTRWFWMDEFISVIQHIVQNL
jgi:hypothetical protein